VLLYLKVAQGYCTVYSCRGFSSRYGSLFLDLCPCIFLNILDPPSMSCVVLVSGLYRTDVIIRTAFMFLSILQGCAIGCVFGGYLYSGSRCLCLAILWFFLSTVAVTIFIASADILIRSLIVFALWVSCKHFIVIVLVCRFLFFA